MALTPDGRKLCLNGCFTVKEVAEFHKHPRSPDGYASRCKSCELDRMARHRHGMNAAEKAYLATEQGGCRVCKRQEPGAKGWVVDHDHSCCPGEKSCGACRRGILCAWCNNALGYALDNPAILRALADYLESGERIEQAYVERVGQAIRLSESADRLARRREQKRERTESHG